MGSQTATVIVVLGAATLGIWFEQRFRARAPETFMRALVNAFVAFVGLQLAMGVATFVQGTEPLVRFVVLFALVIPAFVYVFVAALWIMRALQEALSAYR